MKTKSIGVEPYKTVTKVRLVKEPTEQPIFTITSSDDAYKFAIELYNGDIEVLESFFCIFLNRANRVTSFAEISHGGTSGTVVDSKIIFKMCFDLMAHGIILVHNHPSGNTVPSEADIKLTENLKTIAQYLDIKILDHLIVTPHKYYSFADHGRM